MKSVIHFSIGFCLLVGCYSFAGSLADQKDAADNAKRMAGFLDDTNAACGTSLKTMDIEYKTFEKAYGKNPTENSDRTYGSAEAVNYCGLIANGMRLLCEGGDLEKKAVKDHVKKISCHYNKTINTENFRTKGLKLSGGTIDAGFNWDTANMDSTVRDFLKDSL